MSVLLIFYLKDNQSDIFFTLLVVYDTFTKHGERAISNRTDLEINSRALVT